MPHITTLLGNQDPTQISQAPGFSLEAPGVTCTVIEKEINSKTTRGDQKEDPFHEKIMGSIDSNEVLLLNQFEIEVTGRTSAGTAAGTTRSGGAAQPTAMILNTPKTHKDMTCAVMHVDEAGECRWVFPKEVTAEKFTFELPGDNKEVEKNSTKKTRGAITMGIRKVVKVFAWLTDGIVGVAAMAVVKKWEEKHRPYQLKAISASGEGMDVDWDKYRDKPTLLLIHGTFSTWEAGFYGLFNDQAYQTLFEKYEGRVLAFNHPSLHKSPAENIQELFRMIPNGMNLNLDIVTHSRGGLVGRELIERYDEYDTNEVKMKIGKAIFVAAPHQGTILTNRDNWIKLIDCYTNLVTTLPDNVGTIILESVITLVKVVGGGALKGLPGLQAMNPNGDFLKRLNNTESVDTVYYAIGSNYVPNDEKLLARYTKRILMKILAKIFEEDSDMVVPTIGSFTTGTDNGGFPIPQERQGLYVLEQNVSHVDYFNYSIVNNRLKKWLLD